MTLSRKYDQFYDSSLEKETLAEMVPKRYPMDRVEAIVAIEGSGGRLLDVGCGNGLLLYQFRNRYSTLVGLEYSKQRLEQAQKNLADFNFIQVNNSAENMVDIESDSIDRIISADVIEHIPDVYASVNEMYRVLTPGGQLVINTPNIAFIKKRLLLLFGRFPSTSQPNEGIENDLLFDGGHLHYFTYRSLRIVLERAGFVYRKQTAFGKFGFFHAVWPNLLSVGVQLVMIKPE